MDELKPCLCGSDKVHFGYEPFCGMTFWRVMCDTCGTQTSTFDTKEEAAEKWNTRPTEDALKAEVERLKADNERLKKALKKIDDLTFMPRNKDKVLDRTWHITRAALATDTNVPTNAPDMNVATKESEDSHE